MLARLLDSHPDVYSLPIERGFGRAPRDWLRERTAKSHWPELEQLMALRDPARIESAIDLAQYARLLRRQWFEDNAFDVRLDADVFAEQFRKVLRRSDGWDRQS